MLLFFPLTALPVALFVVFIVIVYFLPTMIAAQNHHRSMAALCLLNILGGILLIGWIAAFIWSFFPGKHEQKTV